MSQNQLQLNDAVNIVNQGLRKVVCDADGRDALNAGFNRMFEAVKQGLVAMKKVEELEAKQKELEAAILALSAQPEATTQE